MRGSLVFSHPHHKEEYTPGLQMEYLEQRQLIPSNKSSQCAPTPSSVIGSQGFILVCALVFVDMFTTQKLASTTKSGAGRWLLAKVIAIQAEGPEFRSQAPT